MSPKVKGVYNPDPQPNPRKFKSKVVAQFVERMPETGQAHHLTAFTAQEGVAEALEQAFMSKGRAMLLLTYNDEKDSKSQQKSQARSRVLDLQRQGYTAEAGWIVRAADNRVYVMYNGEESVQY